MRRWIWQQISLALPEDWEMLQFSREAAAGRCAFADRYRFRLEFNWRKVAGPPDFDRMLSDYKSKLQHQKKLTEGKRVWAKGWQGLEGRNGELFTSRFGRFFRKQSYLVEMVFLWPEDPDRNLLGRVLDGIHEEPERQKRFRHWKAFGMDLLVSKELSLQSCVVEPARANMTFALPKKPGRLETFERLGMVSDWLGASVREWLVAQMPQDVQSEPVVLTEVGGHRAQMLRGQEKAGKLSRLTGKRTEYESAAWICPADGRLYRRTYLGPLGKRPMVETLACCEQLRLGI